MGDYIRTTRQCTMADMLPALTAAIRTHIEKHGLGNVEAGVLMCCETVSSKQKKGFWGGKAEKILTGVLLASQYVIVATGKENEAIGVISARLRDIRVQDYEQSELNKLIPDTGLILSGLRTDSVDLGSSFIGLGPEPAAQAFRVSIKDALTRS